MIHGILYIKERTEILNPQARNLYSVTYTATFDIRDSKTPSNDGSSCTVRLCLVGSVQHGRTARSCSLKAQTTYEGPRNVTLDIGTFPWISLDSLLPPVRMSLFCDAPSLEPSPHLTIWTSPVPQCVLLWPRQPSKAKNASL
ncbi:hypothetical protein TREES_T100006276 [Tupaia chinensis]|uniref:Uncharacterized protein n=1 Tax=Tupaia chinensis TaxID=246437 RepID=L9L9D3_TUPCH|nr:hypothetical protein TREES_T100006276 [Tupaia chinensis]